MFLAKAMTLYKREINSSWHASQWFTCIVHAIKLYGRPRAVNLALRQCVQYRTDTSTINLRQVACIYYSCKVFNISIKTVNTINRPWCVSERGAWWQQLCQCQYIIRRKYVFSVWIKRGNIKFTVRRKTICNKVKQRLKSSLTNICP